MRYLDCAMQQLSFNTHNGLVSLVRAGGGVKRLIVSLVAKTYP